MYTVKQMRAINTALVDEFRANEGRVTGPYGNSQLLVLTTTGSKTGQLHVTPLAYTQDGEQLVVIASKGGGPTSPSWYYNLIAEPSVTVELPGETFVARATVVAGEERARLYDAMAAQIATFAEYARTSTRLIPVVVLERQRP